MKGPLIPEEILTFFVLSNLNKDYSIKQFLRDRERARSKLKSYEAIPIETKPPRTITKEVIYEKEI